MMMAAQEYYTFTGRAGEVIPRHITHVLIAEALNFVRARAFQRHPNIQEVICHAGVQKIETEAFSNCPRLRRVIMPGVKVIEKWAFDNCTALTYIECGKLERIGEQAFVFCTSLSSINLPSIKIVEGSAFASCKNLTSAKFGKDLESFGERALRFCPFLERIALPLKDGMMVADDIFQRCVKLNHVDLVEGSILSENIDALLIEEWKDDMNAEIDTIRQILPNTPAGNYNEPGGMARAIRTWIRSVLRKIIHYKAEHRRCLNMAAATLQLTLPHDIVFKSVLPFVDPPAGILLCALLPADTFDEEKLPCLEEQPKEIVAKNVRYKSKQCQFLSYLPNNICYFEHVNPFVELPSDTFGGGERLAREEQAKEMLATLHSLPCRHGADPDCLELDRTVLQFVHAFGMEFDEAVECGDQPNPQIFLIAAKDATMDEFAAVWKEFAMMDMAISFLLCKGTQDILEGEFLDARKSALFVRYFEQYIAVELLQARALINWPKIGELYVADDHTLVKFYRNRIPCSCLDEKYQEVKHITKMGLCWNPECSVPGRSVERSKIEDCSCRRVTYCSFECQVVDWSRHKPICDKNAKMIAEFEAKQERVSPVYELD